MRRFVPRALLTAFVAVSAACSAAGAGVDPGGDLGGRYLVMIPNLEGPSGAEVANELRAHVTEMATHAAINDRAVRSAMSEYDLDELNEITARQLAQQIRAQLVSWGAVTQGGAGLEADIRFIDTRSGDEIAIEDATGATPAELAASIFSRFETSVEGIRQAAFCNDYLSSDQYDRALETCEAALAIVPSSTAALYGKATALLQLERNQESLDVYEQLLDIDAAHQDALLGAGLAASRLDNRDAAMGFYNRYMEVNPGNVQVRMTVANDIAQTGDYISAFRILEPAVADEAENADFQQYLFSIATAAGQRAQELNSPEANEIFSVALSAYEAGFAGEDDLDASALRQAIAVNNALGRDAEAQRLAQQATQRFPDDAQVWSQYATVLSTADDHSGAAQALTRVIQIDADYENAYIRRAQAHLRSGQRQQAMSDLEQAAQRGDRQNVAQVLLALGSESLNANNFDDAATVLQAANEYAEGQQRNQIRFFWGYALYKQGEAIARNNTQGAVQPAQRALEIFRRVPTLIQGTGHNDAPAVLAATEQFIANQEAIIRAGTR